MSLAGVTRELREVALVLIDEPALPSRSAMDEQKMDELVASMRADGFTSAMVLARVGERYEVIAGHRRWHAARRAGISYVNALVFAEKTPELIALQFGENEWREDLSPADEAIWFAQELERLPELGTDGLAARCRITRDRVERRLALLSGCEDVFRALQERKIGVGVAEQLNRCSNRIYRRMLLDNAIRNGATVAMVASWIGEFKASIEPATRDALADGAAAPPSAPVVDPYFKCAACDATANPERMRPLQVHDYCIAANLQPALELWHRRQDYLRKPRTQAEAVELINQLTDDWPGILTDSSNAA